MTTRLELQQRLFPNGIPKLWCPPLTFFSGPHILDAQRIEQHLQRISAYVGGILVPGSTGEGWEMSDADIDQLLKIVMPLAAELKLHVSIGILKTSTRDVLSAIDKLSAHLQHPASVGLTVCSAKGAELSQGELVAGLADILELGLPTSLYQLPQVTQNELQPASVERLIGQFQNIILFKDTSGEDRVANSGIDTGGVFMVRGAERGGYATWLRPVGGAYDGFLLSTANCFAAELAAIIEACHRGDHSAARQQSNEVAAIVTAAFELVAAFPTGNAFTNANKAIDHLKTYQRDYAAHQPPMLYSGTRLPLELIETLARQFPTLISAD